MTILNFRKKNIYERLKEPFFVLAPMEAVTDTVFRRVVMKAGRPDLFFTEFTNSDGWCSAGRKVVGRRLEFKKSERPLIAQIWGTKPDNIATMCKDIEKLGFDGVDLNMGCPEASVVRGGACSGLIKNPKLAGELIEAAMSATKLPVSVKTRLGFSKVDEWKDWLGFLLEHKPAALTIHLRTRKEMSKVPAHFELLADIIKLRDSISPKTKLVANGDILDYQHGLEIINSNPGLNGVMIGRGVFQNIFCFNKIKKTGTKEELIEMLKFHIDLFKKELVVNPNLKFEPLKRFFKIYIREFDGASELRANLMECRNIDDVDKILNTIDKA
jgi:tRNA-dihydrouridine synthase